MRGGGGKMDDLFPRSIASGEVGERNVLRKRVLSSQVSSGTLA